jgi:hypothetical protein
VPFDLSVVCNIDELLIQGLKSGTESVRLAWREIAKVSAYRRDLFSTDLICVFFAKNDDTGVEIHEQVNGWIKFIESLSAHLPGCKPVEAWLWDNPTPAFATNLVQLYFRIDPTPEYRGVG